MQHDAGPKKTTLKMRGTELYRKDLQFPMEVSM